MSAIDAVAVRALSDLCLMLARAFLPPTWEGAMAAMARDLGSDLRDGTVTIGIDAESDLQRFHAAMGSIADQPALLGIYSHLFLAPPVPAPLNGGLYLDGALDGRSVAMMEDCYRRHGVERAPHFKDLSDHLSVQLEFLSLLLGTAAENITAGRAAEAERLCDDARSFAVTFVQAWLPDLAERVAQASAVRGYPDAYGALLRILYAALGVFETSGAHHATAESCTGTG